VTFPKVRYQFSKCATGVKRALSADGDTQRKVEVDGEKESYCCFITTPTYPYVMKEWKLTCISICVVQPQAPAE
ncbi:hypothetical protein KUCAC02_022289, partial [Chaenocephalus aceratus]